MDHRAGVSIEYTGVKGTVSVKDVDDMPKAHLGKKVPLCQWVARRVMTGMTRQIEHNVHKTGYRTRGTGHDGCMRMKRSLRLRGFV